MTSISEIQANFLEIIAALQRSLSDGIQDGSLEVQLRKDSQIVSSRLDLIIKARENYSVLSNNVNNELTMKLNAIIDEVTGSKTKDMTMIDEQRYAQALSQAKDLRTMAEKLQAQISELQSELAKEELDDAALIAQANSVSEKANALISAVLDPLPAAPVATPATGETNPPESAPLTPDL